LQRSQKTETPGKKKTDQPVKLVPQPEVSDGVPQRGDVVQYIGDEFPAYRGQKGALRAIVGDTGAVLLDGASIPVNLPLAHLITVEDNLAADPQAVVTSKRPRFRFIANTSGGKLSIPDLRTDNPDDEGLMLEASEKVDLLQFFTPEQINRCKSLPTLLTRLSVNNGLPVVTVLESMDDPLPEGSTVIPMAAQMPAESTIDADINIYDEKLNEDVRKEEERNEKLAAMALNARRTTKHGAATKGMGRRA